MSGMRKYSRWVLTVALFAGLFLAGMMAEDLLFDEKSTVLRQGGSMSEASAQAGVEESLPDVVERVVPAVVNIQSKAVVKQGGPASPWMDDPTFRRFFEDFFRHYNVPREREQQYLGSGVIVSADGYVLTNNHLVQNADEIEVILPDERKFDAKVIGTDPRSDIAVLKIDAVNLPSVALGNSGELRLGQTVLAIGYPFAVGQTVTRGIVSALGRSLNLVDYEDFIQTDAAINPGNSGGALINTRGELVGINTAIYSRSGGNMGIGFAIPIELARNIMDNLIAHGRVIRGYVGVTLDDVNPDMAEFFSLKDAGGVVISDVKEGSPAEKAGIERGDVVTMFDGRKISKSDELRRYAAEAEPGSRVAVEIVRDGKPKTIELKMGENPQDRPAEPEKAIEDKNPVFLGVGLETLTDEHRQAIRIPLSIKGVVITQVDSRTPAHKAGLARGDVIVEVNRRKISDLEDFKSVLDAGRSDKVLLLIYRGGSYFYRALTE